MGVKYLFVQPRRVEPAAPDERDVPWLERADLPEVDHPQLLECILQRIDPTVTAERLRVETARQLFIGPLDGFDDVPIECWDVADEDGAIYYQLWLFFADCGVLIESDTTKLVGDVTRCVFYGDEYDLDASEARELSRALHEAQRKIKKLQPKSELASVAFRF